MTPPRISVIMPTYNRPEMAAQTIENMLAQTWKPYEFIVVDDGSPSEVVERLRRYEPQIRLVTQANAGPAAARNNGLRQVTGDFVQIMDDDDLCSLNKLEAQCRALIENEADICFSPWVKLRFAGATVAPEDVVLQQRMPSPQWDLVKHFLLGWNPVLQTMLFRRSFLQKVGFYREDLKPSEDMEYLSRLLHHKPRVAFTDACILLYRVHSSNISGSGAREHKLLIDLARLHLALHQHCQDFGYACDHLLRMNFRRHNHYLYGRLQRIPETPPDLLRAIAALEGDSSAWRLKLSEYIKRLRQRRQQLLTGARWGSHYEAGPLSKAQINLIAEAGYEVVSKP